MPGLLRLAGFMLQALASPFRNLLAGVIFMLVVMAASTAAYVAYGWSFGDALYMVVLTVYTVGYDEVRPIDTTMLRTITITLIVTGCTGMIFLTGSLIQLITVSQFQALPRDQTHATRHRPTHGPHHHLRLWPHRPEPSAGPDGRV